MSLGGRIWTSLLIGLMVALYYGTRGGASFAGAILMMDVVTILFLLILPPEESLRSEKNKSQKNTEGNNKK